MRNIYDVNNDGKVNVSDVMVINNYILNSNNSVADKSPEYYKNNPEYPEYYGAKGDGINFYDWNLVCFNGEVSNILVEQGYIDIEVFAPSERITNTNIMEEKKHLLTYNVFYNKNSKLFVYKSSTGQYYKNWKNSYLWNDINLNKPRVDTVYSDISLDTPENCETYFNTYMYNANNSETTNNEYRKWVNTLKSKRISYIWSNNMLVDIETQMTDDTEAIKKCISANKGNLTLAPNRIYYCTFDRENSKSGKIKEQGFKTYPNNNFVIDGNNSTLFCRVKGSGLPPYTGYKDSSGSYFASLASILVFRTNTQNNPDKCSNNYTIKNLKFGSIRDRDNGCPKSSSYQRYSSSSSCICALSIDGKNVNIKNITVKNFASAIGLSGEFNTIENLKAYGVENNHIGGKNNFINNIEIVQSPYIGGYPHLNYGSGDSDNLIIANSKFRQVDGNTEVMITSHGHYEKNQEICHVYYDNCLFEGALLFKGNGYVMGTQWIHFNNCIFNQIFNTTYALDKVVPISYLINATTNNIELNNCLIHSIVDNTQILASNFKEQQIILTNNNIFMLCPNNQLISSSFIGTLISNDNKTNCTGILPINFNNNNEISDLLTKYNNLKAKTELLNEIIFGTKDDIIISLDEPINPNLNDTWLKLDTKEFKTCTNIGSPTKIAFVLATTFSSALSQTVTLEISPIETLNLILTDVTSIETLKTQLISELNKNGYSQVSTVKTLTNGTFMIYDKSTMFIVTKTNGNLYTASKNKFKTGTLLKSIRSVGTSGYSSVNGKDPIWEKKSFNGLIK